MSARRKMLRARMKAERRAAQVDTGIRQPPIRFAWKEYSRVADGRTAPPTTGPGSPHAGRHLIRKQLDRAARDIRYEAAVEQREAQRIDEATKLGVTP